jgi:hypothetical protein
MSFTFTFCYVSCFVLLQSGRDRRMVATSRTSDIGDVAGLEDFKPPNTTALRFY